MHRKTRRLAFFPLAPLVFLFALLFALTPASPMPASTVKAEPLTVNDGLGIVTSGSYEVQIARENLEAARQEARGAKAGRLPKISVYADQTWLENRPEAIFGAASSPLSEDEFFRYGVTFRQSLTDFGRTKARIGSAEAQRMAFEGRLEETANATALDFLQSYIALLQAGKNLEVTRQEIRMFEAHLSDARALYEAGEVTRSDILYAEVNLAEGALKNLIAQDNLEVAASRVNFFVLRPLDQPLEIFEFPPPFTGVPEVENLVKEAEANRPELRILSDRIASLESRLAFQKREHYPRLFAGGGYSYEENPYRVHEDNWSVMLGMTWDLYSGGAVSAAGEKAMRDLSAALTEREKARTSISLQVREELQRLRGAVSRVEVASRALLQAEENLRLFREKYHEGEASATEVTDAVTALTRAGNNHWAAVYDRMRAQARILYATGSDLAAAYQTANVGAPANIGNRTDEKQGE